MRTLNEKDINEQAKIMLELENAIVNTLKPFYGEDVNEDLAKEMSNVLYKNICSVGLKASIAAWADHLDLYIEHPEGPEIFQANISIKLKSDEHTRETTQEVN